MKKRERRAKRVQSTAQKKRMRQLQRRKKNHYSVTTTNKKKRNNKKLFLSIPEYFSLSENVEETTLFFSEVFNMIKKCARNDKIFFDLGKIVHVTADAIMYLIAIINNAKKLRFYRVSCGGNMPTDKKSRELFERVGFYNHVKQIGEVKESKDNNRIKIRCGTELDVTVTSNICDFVNEKIEVSDSLQTKRLYSMLVELMANVKQHAYNDKGSMNPKWYVYSENCEKDIKFVFLDTGAGIPTTVRKNVNELLRDGIKGLIGGESDDAVYIEAALAGERRTETKEEHRGKGLPEIYRSVTNDSSRLNRLEIISGHGKCKINKNHIERGYIKTELEGTLFMWSFDKEVSV